jgi:hypothetical protein
MNKPKRARLQVKKPQPHKRRGPAPHLTPMEDTHVFLPPDLKEWAKHQEEGLANLVRGLLVRERKHRERVLRSADKRRQERAWGKPQPDATAQIEMELTGDEGQGQGQGLLLGR